MSLNPCRAPLLLAVVVSFFLFLWTDSVQSFSPIRPTLSSISGPRITTTAQSIHTMSSSLLQASSSSPNRDDEKEDFDDTTIRDPTDSSSATNEESSLAVHPFCKLPGDPSLLLTTNVNLGSKKVELMKGTIGQ